MYLSVQLVGIVLGFLEFVISASISIKVKGNESMLVLKACHNYFSKIHQQHFSPELVSPSLWIIYRIHCQEFKVLRAKNEIPLISNVM